MSSRRAAAFCVAFVLAWSAAADLCAQTITRGPYLQRGSPTEVTVRWRTNFGTPSRVWHGPAPGSLTRIVDDPAFTTEHAVRLTGFAPGTTVYYAVGTPSSILAGGDAAHVFRTFAAAGAAEPTRAWIIGDSGTKDNNARAVRDAWLRFTGERGTDLWLMLGDNAYTTGTDAEYQTAVFSNMYESLLRTSVLFPAFGNHDAASADAATQSGPYFSIFTLPKSGESGGVPSNTEAYYAVDCGNVHFVCIDSSESDPAPGSAMNAWLQADLAATDAQWIVAYFHHPPYTKGSHDSDVESGLVAMRTHVVPLLEAAGVDLVLTGHSHSYERSLLIDGHYGTSGTFGPAMIVDGGDGAIAGDGAYRKPAGIAPHAGAVYAVAGSSGKIEDDGPLDHPIMVTSLLRLGSLALDVHGQQLDLRFLDEKGFVRDAFTIVKGGVTPVALEHELVAAESAWTYHDLGIDLGTAWRQTSFDDAGWAVGNGTFGYGDPWIDTTVSFGGNPSQKHRTTYLRRAFVADALAPAAASVRFHANFDDGIVVYLNGQEVGRRAMPAGTIGYATFATNHEGGEYEVFDLSASGALVAGANVLAVEVHQATASSTDLAFDGSLEVDLFTPVLGPVASGSVGLSQGGPFDLLTVNGSAGGLARSVDVQPGSPIQITVSPPPFAPGGAAFALFADFGIPPYGQVVPVPGVGPLAVIPTVILANNLGQGPLGAYPSTPAPWTLVIPPVLGPVQFTLQAIVAENMTTLRPTNAVAVRVL